MSNVSWRFCVAGCMTLGLIVLIGVTAVFDPAERERRWTREPEIRATPRRVTTARRSRSIPPRAGACPPARGPGQAGGSVLVAARGQGRGRREVAPQRLAEDPGQQAEPRTPTRRWTVPARAGKRSRRRGRKTRTSIRFVMHRFSRCWRDSATSTTAPRSGPAERLAQATLEKAEALRRTGNYTQGRRGLCDVAKANATPGATSAPLPDELVQKAIIGAMSRNATTRSRRTCPPGWGHTPRHGRSSWRSSPRVSTALHYVFYFAVAMGLFIFLARVPDLPAHRREVVVNLKDLVSSAGGQAGSQPLGGPDRAPDE